jgi:hypothetical protein
MAKAKTQKLYNEGKPASDFNLMVKAWLDGLISIREHKSPAAFEGIRAAYNLAIALEIDLGLDRKAAHITALSNMTKLLFEHDLTGELRSRLVGDLINTTGFRTTLAQGFAKNVGENFVNLIVYALSELLKDNDSGYAPSNHFALRYSGCRP